MLSDIAIIECVADQHLMDAHASRGVPHVIAPLTYSRIDSERTTWLKETNPLFGSGHLTPTITASGFRLEVPRNVRDLVLVSFARISVLPQLSHLEDLSKLSLCEMKLTEIPSLSSLIRLEELVLRKVLLRELSDGIADAPRLSSLMVVDCQRLRNISSGFIQRLSQLSSAEDASLGLTKLVMLQLPCEAPADIGQLAQLQVLVSSNLTCKSLHDGIVFRSLKELSIASSRKTPIYFQLSVTSLLTVVRLTLDLSNIREMPSLLNCPCLLELVLTKLRFKRLPIEIAHAPNLKSLRLQQCQSLEAIDPAFIRRLTEVTESSPDPLRLKNLHIESIHCAIPHEINELYGLEHLVMVKSSTNGSWVPFPDIGRTLTALKVLNVMGHHDYKSLPEDLSGLTSLHTLKLRDMNITKLPSSIKYVTSLKTLVLRDIHLVQLPSELGALTQLAVLKVTDCKFLSDIDAGFLSSTSLVKICFRNNNMDHVKNQPKPKMFWHLAKYIRRMRDVPIIRIEGGGGPELTAIAEAFRAWPPLRATQIVFDERLSLLTDETAAEGQVEKANEEEEEAMTACEAYHEGLLINRSNLETVHEWHNTQEKVMAFCMGMCKRLGVSSCVYVLEELTISTIVDMVMGRTAFQAKWAPSFAAIANIDALQEFERFVKAVDETPLFSDSDDNDDQDIDGHGLGEGSG